MAHRDRQPGSALTKRILDLGQKIDEIERVLASWPTENGEGAFVRSLGASVDRLRDELEQTRALLEQGQQGDHAPDVAENLTPADALDLSPNRAMSPRAAVAGNERSGIPKTHVLRIPWARDVEVSDDEWDQIQEILSSRPPEVSQN